MLSGMLHFRFGIHVTNSTLCAGIFGVSEKSQREFHLLSACNPSRMLRIEVQ